MESVLWIFRTRDSFSLAWPICIGLAICLMIGQLDMLLLLGARIARVALGRDDGFRPLGKGERPTGLVIIPSLLRNEGDLDAFTTTIESCGTNGYPSELVIIAAVDGRTEHPELLARLERWVAEQSYPDNVHVYVTGTPTRLGKMMAVESGVQRMHELVAEGRHARFPDVYFSIDGDGTLGAHALERLVARLCKPHPLTGDKRRVVSGKICIRPDLLWQGWRKLFTVQGQIYIQVAREFVVSNVARHNWKLTPKIGIPGALYCTWSELLVKAPYFMGFMQSIRFRDWIGWWFGKAPPRFSEARPRSLPEALTGASDDTCIAFIASIASWRDGRLSFDAPRTPLHALGRFLRAVFVERSHDYEPEARVYTYTPTSIGGLWRQRVRWNSSRFECAGRFWRSFWFHWEIGLPVVLHLSIVLNTVIGMTTYYVLLPYFCLKQGNPLFAYLLGYFCQTVAYTLYTVMALLLERERRSFWRVIWCLPLSPLHCICINFFGCVYGVTRDLLLFGNKTSFAPEWTMAKGGCERVALMFRARRFLALCVRSLVYGDVPLGLFWLGWKETRWTPNGFDGWTTGKKQRPIIPRPSLASLRRVFGLGSPAPALAAARPSGAVSRRPIAPGADPSGAVSRQPIGGPRLSLVPPLPGGAAVTSRSWRPAPDRVGRPSRAPEITKRAA